MNSIGVLFVTVNCLGTFFFETQTNLAYGPDQEQAQAASTHPRHEGTLVINVFDAGSGRTKEGGKYKLLHHLGLHTCLL
jgi:hypothetical protein